MSCECVVGCQSISRLTSKPRPNDACSRLTLHFQNHNTFPSNAAAHSYQMTPHAFVKRQRSASVESAASSTSNKRTGSSSSSATTHLAAMDLNASSDSSATSSSASTEPLAMDDEASTDARTAKSPRQTPPAPNEQLNIVVAAAKQPMQAGDNWFLIDRRWYRRWQAACGDPEAGKEAMDSASLGPIDNSSFADPMTGAITKAPVEGQDVEYLPTDAWFFLEAWLV